MVLVGDVAHRDAVFVTPHVTRVAAHGAVIVTDCKLTPSAIVNPLARLDRPRIDFHIASHNEKQYQEWAMVMW